MKFPKPLQGFRRYSSLFYFSALLVFVCVTLFFTISVKSGGDIGKLCEIGDIPWTFANFKNELNAFQDAYDARPISHSVSGSNLFHAFAQWCLIRMLKPKFIIESGVMLGWGTFMLRKAAGPDVHIIVISPKSPIEAAEGKHKFYMDSGLSTYLTGDKFSDFNKVNWDLFGLDTPAKKASALIYFDDHQSGYRRLLEAQQAGFVHAMYDDGYPWPGDNYALKQACDRSGNLELVRFSLRNPTLQIPAKAPDTFSYQDNFGKFKTLISVQEKQCIADDMLGRVETYYEFPPLWAGPFRSQNGPLLEGIRQRPLLNYFEAKQFLQKFVNLKDLKIELEAGRYTFFTYVKIKETFKPAADCLGQLNHDYKLPV